MVTVTGVEKGSAAEKAGARAGDILLEINGHPIADVLDYRFYLAEKEVTLLLHRGEELVTLNINKGEYDDIGLDFETYLMDGKRSCRNGCVFCFIDQLPKGMREPLYFKDDDSRMSFLMGHYVTLTNLSEEETDRIARMKTSPMNISVHTTDPALRVKMMRNKNAGKIMETLRKFAAAGITLHCQIVLCRGLNDGEALDRTMRDLASLYPAMESCSIVPAGLTDHREGLYPLEPFSPEECRAVISQVTAFADICRRKYGSRLFFVGDEMYVRGRVPLPKEGYYEGYPQIENGVGLIRSMKTEFDLAMSDLTRYDLKKKRKVTIATGKAAAGFLTALSQKIREAAPATEITVIPIENRFFGHLITVAGLLTGRDLTEQLRDRDLGDRLLLSASMLRHERDRFLDDTTPEELEKALGVPVVFTENDGYDFLDRVLY